jgi:hypothetical protein
LISRRRQTWRKVDESSAHNPVAYTDEDLKKFFGACEPWHKAHVRAKPQYDFLPKDWEERIVPFSQEVADILGNIRASPIALWFFLLPRATSTIAIRTTVASRSQRPLASTRRNGISTNFGIAATDWLRAGIDVRTVQA